MGRKAINIGRKAINIGKKAINIGRKAINIIGRKAINIGRKAINIGKGNKYGTKGNKYGITYALYLLPLGTFGKEFELNPVIRPIFIALKEKLDGKKEKTNTRTEAKEKYQACGEGQSIGRGKVYVRYLGDAYFPFFGFVHYALG